MPPNPALLPSRPQCGIVIEQRYGRAAEGNVVAPIAASRIDRRQVPDGNGQLCVGRKRTVVDRQSKPLVPYPTVLEVFVWRLRVYGKRLGVGEGLDRDVQL